MKRSLYLIIMLISSVLCGCKQEEEIDGGLMYRNIYVSDGGNVIDAQGYSVEFPASGGTVSLSIVGGGDQIHVHSQDWLNVEKDGAPMQFTSSSDDKFVKYSWYVQNFLFTAPPNTSGKSRTLTAKVVCLIYNGYAADFTITQAGK
ncbi:MAG: hypothetical protein NC308_03730 [Clostridium sp.]|nr:hypothetical protein [Bacteroides sp.]MCM1197978.1 hypothetical protein [Clostridium sp.]